MHRSRSLAGIALTALALLVWASADAVAQGSPRALVYCPVGLDTGGCDNIVAALGANGTGFIGGVDRGWDGTSGTVDLASADLSVYAVIVVPSLADGADGRPYDRLRVATVAARLKAVISGRQAIWSGTPDLGSATASEKTLLIQSLAAWAASGSGTGLVGLLDGSDSTPRRYDWVAGISALAVVADSIPGSYASVRPLTATGAAIAIPGGQALAYGNMAAFGVHAGSGSTEDVADSATGMPVLVTTVGAGPAPPQAPAPTGLRALVYCPTADAGGCDNIVAALTGAGTPFVGGADRGFDGTGGTVDLRTADLSGYVVFVVPSLADGADGQPYAALRDPVVAGRLKAALGGPVAVWSGTPDLGDSSRAQKNILITNLAKWAAGAAQATASARGLVALQDASDSAPARYSWISLISRASVAPDTTLDVYSNVQALTSTAATLLDNGSGLQLGYGNMASFGLVPGAGLGADATGGRTSAIVLATSASTGGAGAGFATVTTDREDYQPGDTITVTGAGWAPGETVSLLFHEEVSPPIHPDKTLTAVADAGGHIVSHQYEVESTDLGVRFALVATGQTSGRTAQTTFTDDRTITAATVAGGSSVTVVVGQSITASVTASLTTTGGGGPNWLSTSWQYATTSPGGSFNSPCADTPDHTVAGTFTESFSTTAPAAPGTYNGYFLVWRTASCGNNPSTLFTLSNAVTVNKGNSTTSVTSSAGSTVFGQGVTFTATVAAAAPATGNPLGSVDFKDGATTIGSGTLSCAATCTATFSTSTLSIAGSPHSITAVYAGNASFNGSTSAPVSQTVTPAGTTTTAASPGATVFGQSFTFTATVAAQAPGTGTPTGTIQFRVDAGNVGAPVTLSGASATSPSVSGLTVGVHTLAAVYSGDANFTGSTSAGVNQTVIRANTATAITSDTPDPSNPGDPVAVAFTVTASAPGTGIPSGNVTVSDGVNSCVGTAAAGTCSVSLATPGPRTLTAVYAGDAGFNGSTSPGAAHSVNAAATLLTVSPASGTFGGTAALSAMLTSGGSPVAGKSIAFTLNGTSAGPATTDASGTASIAAASLGAINAGSYPAGVGASFAGDASFAASIGSGSLTVSSKATTLTLTVVTPSVVYGATASVSAKLSESSAGHTITFSIDGTPVATTTTNPSGNTGSVSVNLASFPAIGAGSHSVTAAFAGETNFGASTASGTITVTPGTATVALSNLSPSYDGTPKAATVTTTPTALAFSVTYNGSATAPTNAGSYAVVATITDPNYTGSATGTLTIGPATVTGHFTANSRGYDGTTAATIATRSLTGALGTDDVSLSGGTATFSDKQVGTAKTVTGIGFGLTGTKAGNYVLASTTLTTTADITPRTLTVTATGQSRVYDATTAATVTLHDDRVSGDGVTVGFTSATFGTKNVGNGKTVTVIGLALSGADGGDYQLASTMVSTTADITPASLVPHITADSRVYDGTTVAAIATRSLTGILLTDVVSLTGGTASFADKNVGTAKTVTGTGFSLAGGDAGNYQLDPTTATATADITARTLMVTATGQNRVYDATTAATVTLHDDRIPGDNVTLSYTSASFDTKTVGNGKPVSVSGIAIGGGADAGNYHLGNTSASTTADITPASLVPHITADSRVYDGTTAAAIATRSLTGILLIDVVSLAGGTASFADKNVGTAKAVTGTGFSLAGGDAGNYQLDPLTATTNADITPRPLVVTATGQNRVYDATTAATVTLSDDRVSGDNLTVSYTGAAFADKNVGNGKPVSVSGIALSGGADAGNYHPSNTTATTTANITPASLVPHITADSRVYDGTTVAAIAIRSLTGILLTDVVSLTGGTANFADKHAGMGKTVTGDGFGLAGLDGGNYILDPTTTTTTADISPRPITVTADAQTKVYGDPDPALSYHVTSGSLILGDAIGGALTRVAGETVPLGPYPITQGTLTAGSDYALTFVSASLTITTAPLTVTAANNAKVYGDPVPAPLTGTIVGIKFADNISATYTAYVSAGGIVVTPTTPVSGSPYPIIPYLTAVPSSVLANYAVTPVNGMLTVLEAPPSFRNLVIPNVVFGQASSTVSGTLSYVPVGGPLYPTGTVSIVVNGQTRTATIQPNGSFTATFSTSGFPVNGSGHVATLSYDGSDPNFTPAGGTGAMIVVYNTAVGHQFLQPINIPPQQRSAFKIGSTIPVKFQLFLADGATQVANAVASIQVNKLSSGVSDPVNEDVYSTVPDQGINFRYTGGQYIFNLGTKNVQVTTGTYRVTANLNDGSTIIQDIEMRAN